MDELTEELYAVSDPSSPKYGQHWTKAQVAEFTKNEEGYNRIKEYLDRFGIKVVSETLHGEYITAEASVGEWESFFKTDFYEYTIDRPRSKPRANIDSYADIEEQKTNNGEKLVKVIRTEEYSLPGEIADDLHAAFNTIHFPQLLAPRLKRGDEPSKNKDKSQKINKNLRSAAVGIIPGEVTPEFINQYYDVKNNTGGSIVTQAIFASLDEGFSPNDLTYFQNYFGLPIEPIADEVGGHVSNNACNPAYFNDCVESHLDVQYMMGVASGVPTTYWYVDTTPYGGVDWVAWLTTVANQVNPQDVFSISYASYEAGLDREEVIAFNTEAIKLGTMGTTILAASGDDGAVGWLARDDSRYCAYMAMFPASSPYVTAVGGTNGPQNGLTEVSCLSNKNAGVITTGGGFSYYSPYPAFQETFINKYFKKVEGKSYAPYYSTKYSSFWGIAPGKYNRYHRGYPDISLIAVEYNVAVDASLITVYGTSASSPVMGGMTSLANYQRKLKGYSTMGWMNPFLYAYAKEIVLNDIVNHDKNNCCAGHGSVNCCQEGFPAAEGWDPVTGILLFLFSLLSLSDFS
jgi:tripeptidyl-peptidase-1